MRPFFGYVRVSTVKQGEHGVSLQEQRDAILRHAQRQNLLVAQWFEERETAAKRGRPVFNQMLKLLREGKANGVIIHKIDRSARNLRDWSDLGELIDQGIEVHFANESLDLHTRGGRLTADIQAVVAADYVRNLREEAKKGIYGRLKQGLWPMQAPPGYLDCGGGKPKELDPVQAPLIRRSYELYGTGRYTLDRLVDEMFALGLRNRRGNRINRSMLSRILNNPFYIGLLHIQKTGETFDGVHQPIISKSLFDRVQLILQGKATSTGYIHPYQFRRLLTCRNCRHALTGERQKGHVYYRCHSKACPTFCVREEMIEEKISVALLPLQFDEAEKKYLEVGLEKLRRDWGMRRIEADTALRLHKDQIASRLNRLTDAYLDGILDKDLFEQRKEALLIERKDVEERLASAERDGGKIPDRVTEFFELAGSAYLSYVNGNEEEKRALLKNVTSNRWVEGKNVQIELHSPFRIIAERHISTNGRPHRNRLRTLDGIITALSQWISQNNSNGIQSPS